MEKTSQALVKITSSEWLTKCETPNLAIESLRDFKTVDDSIAIRTPSLGAISREKGRKYALGYVKLWIIYFQGNLNIKNTMNEGMIELAAQMLFDTHPSCTLADIKIVFTDALMGHYGEFYEALSIPKIMGWFNDYFEERIIKCAEISYAQHLDLKEQRPFEWDEPVQKPNKLKHKKGK